MKRMTFALISILFHAAASFVTGVNAQNFWQQTNGDTFRSIQSTNPSSAINFGETICSAISNPSETDTYTFTANTGDRILVRASRASGNLWSGIRVVGNGIILRQTYGTPTAEIDTLALPTNGTYSILVYDGFDGTRTGNYCVSLQRLNNPGNAVSFSFGHTLLDSIGVAAKMGTYTFSANAGDRLLVRMSRASGTLWSGIRVYSPNGKNLRSTYGTPTAEIDTLFLPLNGLYCVLAYDGFDGTRTGSYGIHVQRVNNTGNAVTIDFGQTLSGSIDKPAEMEAFTFSAGAGKRIQVTMSRGSGAVTLWPGVRIYSPTGKNLRATYGTPTAQIDTLTLPISGAYTIVAYDGFDGTRTGAYNVTLICLTPPCPSSGCSYSISPISQSFGPSGGSGTINVTATAGCSWSAASNTNWLRITSGNSGTGNGTTQYIVDAHTGTGSRTGMITFSGQNFSQAFTVTQSGSAGSRIVRVVNAGASPGGTVNVPIELISQGNENALGFSLSFDPSILSNPQAARVNDATAATLITNASEAHLGRYGILLSLPTGQAFAAGTRQIVVVTFAVNANTAATSTTISFGDQPLAREVVDVNANVLPATWTSGTVTITRGYEADVAPRPNGNDNGTVTVADWVQVGRFVAKLDTPRTDINEFQRADCAPKDSLGTGTLSVADWTQAGRYAARLDPVVRAGGPTAPRTVLSSNAPLAGLKVSSQITAARTVHIRNPKIQPGQPHSVTIELEAEGNENALGFSLGFDQTVLSFDTAMLGNGANGASLVINSVAAANGCIGLVLALPGGQTFSAGTHQTIVVNFAVNPNASVTSSPLVFKDDPIAREIVDANANVLPANWGPVTSVQERTTAAPQSFDLGQNYPNPFNPSTVIRYALPKNTLVKLAIYDLLGAKIRTLVEGVETTGFKQVTWDATNDAGERVPSGVYLYRLEASEFVMTRKLTVMK